MIWFFNLEKASAVSCDNYDDLFDYIHELEKLKLLKTYPQFDQAYETLNPSFEDTEILKKQWCLEYCKSHNYLVVENTSPAKNSPRPLRISQSLMQIEKTDQFSVDLGSIS